jgi:hypothetical protein
MIGTRIHFLQYFIFYKLNFKRVTKKNSILKWKGRLSLHLSFTHLLSTFCLLQLVHFQIFAKSIMWVLRPTHFVRYCGQTFLLFASLSLAVFIPLLCGCWWSVTKVCFVGDIKTCAQTQTDDNNSITDETTQTEQLHSDEQALHKPTTLTQITHFQLYQKLVCSVLLNMMMFSIYVHIALETLWWENKYRL